jgi:hypothetical protein
MMAMLLESMMLDSSLKFRSTWLVLFAAVLFAGCSGGSSTPEVVPMTVTVKTAKGQPINNVLVRFVPQIEGLDGNFIATGVTDSNGTCELKFPGKGKPGCCACEHKVLVLEGPVPDEARANYAKDQGASIERFNNSLKHRPLPKKYSLLVDTPLRCTPSAETSTFDIELK